LTAEAQPRPWCLNSATDTASPAEEKALRSRLERVEDIYAMVLTFGELEPERGGS
jgi:hypothetical protein